MAFLGRKAERLKAISGTGRGLHQESLGKAMASPGTLSRQTMASHGRDRRQA